ncbi:hypothetical protein UFOVP1336_18 [uncultured Caudovirales phage]|uniref:Uncharacterized protein n=1 Tax=uncultured Caudovirales phage TaxID=2100421 RepID=A0A6J5RZB4_9CAUD|nr:hypothetical protein UFOVP1336_18 [uncultured Caudovirales phage]
MSKVILIVTPTDKFSNVSPFSFHKVELENAEIKSLEKVIAGQNENAQPAVEMLGTMWMEYHGDFAVGIFIDLKAEINGQIVDGKRMPSPLNPFATLIKRAAIWAKRGRNPKEIAPVAGTVAICKLDEEGNPVTMTEVEAAFVVGEFSEFLGGRYIGSEDFDQRFLNWMNTKEVESALQDAAREINKMRNSAEGEILSLGDMPFSGDSDEKEYVN